MRISTIEAEGRGEAPAHYDVVVIGGGLVGASFALLLSQMQVRPQRILVIEAVDYSTRTTPSEAGAVQNVDLQYSSSFDARTTALSYGSRLIYQQAGLWTQLAQPSVPIDHIHVSDRGRFGAVRMSAEQQGIEALGYVVENQHLGNVLLNALFESDIIDVLSPASVSRMTPLATGMQLELSLPGGGTQLLETSLAVLAEGGKSHWCQRLGIAVTQQSYEQQALIANITFSRPHAGVAYERFTDSGPLAVLPLSAHQGEQRGALIWTLPTAQAAEMMVVAEPEFLLRLQQRFGRRLGEFQRVGERVSYPLSLNVAREQIRPGLALLGNVAHTLHPVAGQGLNLALRDARALAEQVVAAQKAGEAPGSMCRLQKFLDAQRVDQSSTIHFSHYMTQLFSNNTLPLIWARKFGLLTIDLLPVLKTAFARQAMGMADRKQHAAEPALHG